MITIEQRLSLLKSSAKQRKLKVDLSIRHYSDMINMGCAYCGDTLHDKSGYCLDRIDSTMGYINDNVTPCCKTCNRAKSNMDSRDFFVWIERAYKFQAMIVQQLKIIDSNIQNRHKKECRIIKNKYFNQKKTRVKGSITLN